MVDHLEKYAEEQLEFDTKDMMVKYSLEVIASTAFGVEAQAFSNPNGIFADRVSKNSLLHFGNNLTYLGLVFLYFR